MTTHSEKVAYGRSRKAALRRKAMPLDDRQTAYLKTVPTRWRSNLSKLYREGGTASAAIRLMCCSCMGFEETVPRVRECSITICPLQRFRPYQTGDEDEGVGVGDEDGGGEA